MAFIKKPFKRTAEGSSADVDQYIDLGELVFEDEGAPLGAPAQAFVKVAEIYRYEDVTDLTSHIYNGNILVVDYTAIGNDELALKRITAELKAAARDSGGDVAAIGKNFLIATPAGIRIDRNKIKGKY